MAECTHRWHLITQTEGDPSIPYGTNEWQVYQCVECGEEVQHLPEGAECEDDDDDGYHYQYDYDYA